ncbi:MAG: hypothetical protein H7Y38_12865 [Armatimonadetes bacterium]|nr:hypothetical protein [Armatimonadota bacterium]
MTFAGMLEIHLTLSGTHEGAARQRLQAHAEAIGWKYLHIVLSRGDTFSQPMLTRHVRSDLGTAQGVAKAAAQCLAADGFAVTRTKIETAPTRTDVPQSDEAAQTAPPCRYFEAHIKLLLPPTADIAALTQVAESHGAHLSRNANKERADGNRERFVTVRGYRMGRETAHRNLLALLAALTPLGHEVLETEEEYVIYDSNETEDKGWLTP